jgi:peptidoglycan hydrolase FlgJ
MNALPTLGIDSIALQSSINRRLKSDTSAVHQDPAEKLNRLAKIKKSCGEVESLFVSSLIKAMRQTIPSGGFMAKTPGSDVYEAMIEQQLSQYLSAGVGMGLGQTVFNQMVRSENLEDVADSVNKDAGDYTRTIPVDLLPRDDLRESSTESKGIALNRNIGSDQETKPLDSSISLTPSKNEQDIGQITGGLLP